MRTVLLLVIVLIVGAQFVPVTRDNPPVAADFDGDAAVKAVLKESCYNCHSNETTWPWYSRIAPVSWLVASDVSEAREKLNFSDWGLMAVENQAHASREMWKEVEKGEMPLTVYLLMHSEAELSEADKAVIRDWAGGTAGQTTEPMEEAGE